MLADQKGHRQISLTLAQEVLDLEEQLEAAREEVLFLCSDEDDIRKGLREQVEAADEFKAAMVRANQRQVDEITSLREQLEAAQKALRDFAEHGVRHDLNPTRRVPTPDSFWLTYIDRIDKAVRERARAALVSSPASEPESA